MSTHTLEQICRTAFPHARVQPASELNLGWVGTAITFGDRTYVVYQQDGDAGWNLDTLTPMAVDADWRESLAECLGAILQAHIEATFGFA